MSFDCCTHYRLVQSAASETVQILSVGLPSLTLSGRRALPFVPNDFLLHDEDCHHVVSTRPRLEIDHLVAWLSR